MKKDVDGNQNKPYQLRVRQPQQKMTTTPTNRIRLENQEGQGYLTESEIEKIISQSKELRKGHKRSPGTPWFWVRVDGQSININRTNDLKSLLGTCYIVRSEFEMYRNFMKGITINLDK